MHIVTNVQVIPKVIRRPAKCYYTEFIIETKAIIITT